jgi:hypothetical protein
MYTYVFVVLVHPINGQDALARPALRERPSLHDVFATARVGALKVCTTRWAYNCKEMRDRRGHAQIQVELVHPTPHRNDTSQIMRCMNN